MLSYQFHKVTGYRQTDRHTDMMCLLLRRGIIQVTNIEFCIILITLLIFNITINFPIRDNERFWKTYHSLLNVSLLSKSVFSKSKTCENIPWKIGKPHQNVHTSMVYDGIWKIAKFQSLTNIRKFTWKLDIRIGRLDTSSKTQGLGGDRFASYSKDGKAQTIIWFDNKMVFSWKHEKIINFRHDGRNFMLQNKMKVAYEINFRLKYIVLWR